MRFVDFVVLAAVAAVPLTVRILSKKKAAKKGCKGCCKECADCKRRQ